MDGDLDSAREELSKASERATGTVETQLHSIEDGIFQEEGGERTRSDPGPKVDRIAEVAQKLADLEDEAEDATVRERIATARERLRAYLKAHPEGG